MASEKRENKRPEWCPHHDCVLIRAMIGTICGGRLPKPEEHDEDFNTHRFCLKGCAGDGGAFDLQVNKTDLWWLIRLFDHLTNDMESKEPKGQPDSEEE